MLKHERSWLVRWERFLNLRGALAVALLPPVLAGLFVLAVETHGLVRYDPAYFTPLYAERYDTPGSVALALERALQTGGAALLAELQGLRRPATFKTGSSIIFIMLLDSDGRYFNYLYFDIDTYKRYTHYIEQVGDRWVVTPMDAYYYFHSGRWLGVFLPVALVWWLVEAVTILAVWLYRSSARFRARLWRGEGG
ncbi:MAG TPA: hypothetical protein EYP77_05910 [Anaerolineae bacterium]|nr:hypothetical protein [Anaerolineae bacterium]